MWFSWSHSHFRHFPTFSRRAYPQQLTQIIFFTQNPFISWISTEEIWVKYSRVQKQCPKWETKPPNLGGDSPASVIMLNMQFVKTHMVHVVSFLAALAKCIMVSWVLNTVQFVAQHTLWHAFARTHTPAHTGCTTHTHTHTPCLLCSLRKCTRHSQRPCHFSSRLAAQGQASCMGWGVGRAQLSLKPV